MPTPLPDIWRIELTVPPHAVPAFEAALDSVSETVSWFLADEDDDDGDWVVVGHGRTPPDQPTLCAALELAAAAVGIDVPVQQIQRVPDMDWLTASLKSFPPIAAGRFHVRGSHIAEPPPPGSIALVVDAGTAFGSGEHATTWGCLIALNRLSRQRRMRRVLDMGCGSGILALAAAKAWPARVIAADIDPVAVAVTAFNARRNGVRLRALTSDGYRGRPIQAGAPYDLVIANILARPLMLMAKDLDHVLARGGIAILSGLLARQERMVLSAYRMRHFALVGRVTVNGWHTLVLRR